MKWASDTRIWLASSPGRPFEGEEKKGPGTYWLRMRLYYRNLSRNLTVHTRKTMMQTFLSLEGKPTRFSLWSDKKEKVLVTYGLAVLSRPPQRDVFADIKWLKGL